MCSRSPWHMSEWPIGALPPIVAARVQSAEVIVRARRGAALPSGRVAGTQVKAWPLVGGGQLVVERAVLENGRPAPVLEVVKASGRDRLDVARLVTQDKLGQVMWRVQVDREGRVFATQANPVNPDTGRREWFHFADSLGQDVSPYVHAAVARLVARLLDIPVAAPQVRPEARCLDCAAFRRLPGPDLEVGDAEGRVPSLSTIRKRDEGPWQAEAFWCSARQEVPPDVVRLVAQHNELARRGYPDPVLPLDAAGETCALFLPKGAGRKGGIPAWEIPAGYADEPEVREEGGARVLRVRGAQWAIELPVVAPGARAARVHLERREPSAEEVRQRKLDGLRRRSYEAYLAAQGVLDGSVRREVLEGRAQPQSGLEVLAQRHRKAIMEVLG